MWVCDVITWRQVSSSLIYTWRKQLREGKLADVVPSLPVFAVIVAAAYLPYPLVRRADASVADSSAGLDGFKRTRSTACESFKASFAMIELALDNLGSNLTVLKIANRLERTHSGFAGAAA